MTDQTPPVSRREARARDTQKTTELPTRRRTSAEQPTTRLPVAEPAFHQERTIRPLPIALAAIGAVLAIVLTFVIVGVAGRSAPPPVAATSPTPTPSAVAAPPPPVPSPVANIPRRAAGPNECVDALGEGGSVDLDAVALSLEKGDLVARFQLAAALPDGAASLGIFAESRDGKRSYQLAATWSEGDLDSFFVHDFQRGRDTKLDSRDIDGDDSTVTAAFPDDIAKSLGNGWRWYAFSTADGKDVDACPGDPLSFDSLTFDEDADNSSNNGSNN